MAFKYGDGSSDSPYEINNEADIDFLRERVMAKDVAYVSKSYLQTRDITFTKAFVSIGTVSNDIGFKGVYDGGGHRLFNLNNAPRFEGFGFIPMLYGTIKNLGIESGSFVGSYGGSFCSLSKGGTITNCYNKASARGTGGTDAVLGGICAYSVSSETSVKARFIDCSNYGSVHIDGVYDGTNIVAGIVGGGDNRIVTNCFNSGKLVGLGDKYGICKAAATVVITGSYFDISSAEGIIEVTGATHKTTLECTGLDALVNMPLLSTSIWNNVEYDYPILSLFNKQISSFVTRKFQIAFDFDAIKAVPSAIKPAGVSGEHKATELLIAEPDGYEGNDFYIECMNGMGEGFRTGYLVPVDGVIRWLIPQSVTRLGSMNLILGIFTGTAELRSAPVNLFFMSADVATEIVNEQYESLLSDLIQRLQYSIMYGTEADARDSTVILMDEGDQGQVFEGGDSMWTDITGIVKGDGETVTAAVPGVDYQLPLTPGTHYARVPLSARVYPSDVQVVPSDGYSASAMVFPGQEVTARCAHIITNAEGTKRFTVPAGYTAASLSLSIMCLNEAGNDALGSRGAIITRYRGGTSLIIGVARVSTTSPTAYTALCCSANVPVLEGDVFSAHIYQNSGGNVNTLYTQCSFSCVIF